MKVSNKNKLIKSKRDTISNANSDQIFRLIKAMSKAEKRKFKLLFGSGKVNKKFVQLFDEIDKLKVYDEEKLKHSRFITPGQLPNLKIQLYTKLLDSLKFNHVDVDARKQVGDLIENAVVLYDRCLYHDCVRQLEKARSIALRNDLVTSLVEINELHQRALRLTINENTRESVDMIRQEVDTITTRLKNINGLATISLKLNSLYAQIGSTRNKDELKKVNDFFERQIGEYSRKQTGVEERLYYYQALTTYYLFIRHYYEAKRAAHRWVNLIESNPEIKYQRPESYIKALNSLLVTQNKMYEIEAFTQTFKKLVAIKRDKNFKLNRNLLLQLFKAIYIHEMNRQFMLGDFRTGTKIVGRHLAEINRFLPLLDQHNQFLFCYKIACLYLGAGQFRMALTWLSKITMTGSTTVREDLQSFARILRLICYFEMDDDYGVQSNIKSTYRFLLSRKNYGRYESLIILFLKKLKGNESPYELKKRFVELHKNMLRISKLKYEKRAFIYFDMISWLESKVQNKPIQEIIQSKIKERGTYGF